MYTIRRNNKLQNVYQTKVYKIKFEKILINLKNSFVLFLVTRDASSSFQINF